MHAAGSSCCRTTPSFCSQLGGGFGMGSTHVAPSPAERAVLALRTTSQISWGLVLPSRPSGPAHVWARRRLWPRVHPFFAPEAPSHHTRRLVCPAPPELLAVCTSMAGWGVSVLFSPLTTVPSGVPLATGLSECPVGDRVRAREWDPPERIRPVHVLCSHACRYTWPRASTVMRKQRVDTL